MQDEPRVSCQPAFHPWGFVGGVVVDDQMQGELTGELGVQMLEELQKLLMPVPGVVLAEYASFDDLQRGKKSGRPMPAVVMGESATASGFERQTGLCALQRVDLTLLIDAQHHGVLRWCQIDADHVGELLQKPWVA